MNKTNKTNNESKTNKTNIILTNLSQDTFEKVLELCMNEKIHYTFDKNYYSEEYYSFYGLLDNLILKNNKIPNMYKELIKGEYKDFVEDCEDYTNRNEILQKIDIIEYNI
jgi:hypothetical protein